MFISKLIEKYSWKFLRKAEPSYKTGKLSWAQQGEDLIIDFIFKWYLQCENPFYLDIGAHHPSYLSNTWLFYKKGSRGVNVEADPDLMPNFYKNRKGDININAGVGKEKGMFDFYLMSPSTLNTFSKTEAFALIEKHKNNVSLTEVKSISVIPVNEILESYFVNVVNYFISIDVEGMDFEILQSIDFERFKPPVICIEVNGKDEDIVVGYLNEKGYLLYASNCTNCIFLTKDKFPL